MSLPTPIARAFVVAIHRLRGDGRAHLARLQGARGKTGWDELLTVLEGFAEHEGPGATRKLVEHFTVQHSMLAGLAELLGDVRQNYLTLAELASRQDVVAIEAQFVKQRLSVTLTLRRGFRPSRVFFEACAWLLAALPRLRGLADARVSVQRVTDRELKCVVVPPRDPGPTLEHHDATHAHLAHGTLRPQLGGTSRSLEDRFGLTQAESRVVSRLARGQSLKELAHDLGISSETARTHAKRAMQKTATHRQAELVSLVLSRA